MLKLLEGFSIKALFFFPLHAGAFFGMENRVYWNLKRDCSPLGEKVGRGLMLNGNVSGISLHNWRKPVFFGALMPSLQA